MERNAQEQLTALLAATNRLSSAVDALAFAAPVTHVYNPLSYAGESHAAYQNLYGTGRKRVVFLGMNPGPFGMVQTGIPFGEIAAVTGWMNISPLSREKILVTPPVQQNPARPIEGFACQRSEVSGRRLWGLFAARYPNPADFFADHFVLNYCPLAFFDHGRNLTPDKLPVAEQAPLLAACDAHLAEIVGIMQPDWLVGVGAWAETRAKDALASQFPHLKFGRVLHPSPASPAANRGWAEAATRQLHDQSIW